MLVSRLRWRPLVLPKFLHQDLGSDHGSTWTPRKRDEGVDTESLHKAGDRRYRSPGTFSTGSEHLRSPRRLSGMPRSLVVRRRPRSGHPRNSILGGQRPQNQGRRRSLDPCGREQVPARDNPRTAQLGRALLPHSCTSTNSKGRSLRRLGTTGTLCGRDASGVQVAALIGAHRRQSGRIEESNNHRSESHSQRQAGGPPPVRLRAPRSPARDYHGAPRLRVQLL